jgi:hypothetical protein
MTPTTLALAAIVPTTVMLALAIDVMAVAAVVGSIRRRRGRA